MAQPLTQVPKPSLGRIVVYRAKTRAYPLAAIVSATAATLDREGVRAGHVPDLDPDEPHTVHLHVLTPGDQVTYREFAVPYSEAPLPGTWAWPERV